MSKERFASVWDAIEDSAADAASMKLRADLANEIIERLHARKLTQAKAAELIGVTQPRVSHLMRGRLNLFSLDALVVIADRVGLRTRMVIAAMPHHAPSTGTHESHARPSASSTLQP